MILSVGIIPARKNNGQWELLLLRCYKYWDFPKGEQEQSEDPLGTALRELQEETSLKDIDFPWGEIFYETEPYSKGKVARYYLGKTKGAKVSLMPNPEMGIREHHEFRWVTLPEARKLATVRIRRVLDWAEPFLK